MFTINYGIQYIRIKQLKSTTSYSSFASYIAESKAEKESYLGSAEGQMGSRLTQEELACHAPLEAPELA